MKPRAAKPLSREKTTRSSVDAQTEELDPNTLSRALTFMRVLWAVAHGLESTSKRMHAELGITGPQRLVLRLVGHYGQMSAGEVARTMHVHPSSVTGMLRRLEQSGLLLRRSDRDDARRAVLTLTPQGKRLNAKTAGTVEAVVERALRAISSAEVRAAQRALQVLADEFGVDSPANRARIRTRARSA
jgi:DNA-binding MarR family transcriptional regulator